MHHSLLIYTLILTLAGCGGSPPAISTQTQTEPPSKTPSAVKAPPSAIAPNVGEEPEAAAQAAAPADAGTQPKPARQVETAPAQAFTVDEAVRIPATVEEAAKAIDLSAFPLLPGAADPGRRSVARLSYIGPGDVKAGYEFHKKNLIDGGWKELPGAQLTDQDASGAFAKDGFTVSVSLLSSEPGKVSVGLHNHGNVNLAKLPVPPGAKLQYSFPATTSFVSEVPAAETAAAVRMLLLAESWQPYGTAGDMQQFKKNAIQLDARVFEPPAQPGKTFIEFSSDQLSADMPAPPDASSVQYSDDIKRLNIYMPGTHETVVAYYQSALAPAGWKPTTDHAIKDGFEYFMIFRNPAKDMLTLTMWGTQTEKGETRAHLVHQSAIEVAEEERRFKEALAAKKKKDEEEQNKPKPKALITLPAGAQGVEATAREIEFQLPTGKSKAAVDALTKELTDAGWKADAPIGQAEAGQLNFQKDGHSVSILYVDPGFIPAQITITGSGVELEQAK